MGRRTTTNQQAVEAGLRLEDAAADAVLARMAPLAPPVSTRRVTDIVVGPRRRALRPELVASLAESIAAVGLLQPIVVDQDLGLLAGLHRLEAHRQIGREWIDVRQIEATEAYGALVEIDENLLRAELTPAERAVHLADRKRIWLELHPHTAAGVAGATARWSPMPDDSSDSFAEDTARRAQVSRRTVERETARGEALAASPELRAIVASTELLETNGTELDRLARIVATDGVDAAIEVARRVASGASPRVSRAHQQVIATARLQMGPLRTSSELIDLRCCGVGVILDHLLESGTAPDLVIVDPPWDQYRTTAGAAAPEDAYPVLAAAAIREHIESAYDVAAPGARLALWCTWPLLVEWMVDGDAGIRSVIGSRWLPKTGGSWHKSGGVGVGHHWRGQSEPVIVCTRTDGTPYTDGTDMLASAYGSVAGAHSEKPIQWQRQWIHKWVPAGGLVLDLYAGTGSVALATLLAGEQRRYIGAELDPVRHAAALAACDLPLLGWVPS